MLLLHKQLIKYQLSSLLDAYWQYMLNYFDEQDMSLVEAAIIATFAQRIYSRVPFIKTHAGEGMRTWRQVLEGLVVAEVIASSLANAVTYNL